MKKQILVSHGSVGLSMPRRTTPTSPVLVPPRRLPFAALTTLTTILAAILIAIPLAASAPRAADTPALFERDVLPLFTKHCLGCHGGLKQKGGLDLRSVEALIKGGDAGPGVIPGRPETSQLWQQITTDEMPKDAEKLTANDKETIRRWIAAGLPTVSQFQKTIDPLLPPGEPHAPSEVARAIDRHVERALEEAGLRPAAPAEDAEFLRRVYLDLSGRVPTARQAEEFLATTHPDKRAALVEALLQTPAFGEHFGRTWRDWVAPPELPSDPNTGRQPHAETTAFGQWLSRRFAAGDPWDRIVRDILTAQGPIKDAPEIIFYGLSGDAGKATPDGSARAVASLFMGVQLQCAQCHDDPYRMWSQQEHWSLAAYFRSTSGDFGKITEELPKTPGANPGGIAIPKTAFRNAGTEVTAAFLGRRPNPQAPAAPSRAALADWLTAKDNPFFARAFANRLWFQLFSRGLANPVDDLRELNPPSHPGLLQLLANEFTASGFNIRHLVRCMVNSHAYQRTSRGADSGAAATSITSAAPSPGAAHDISRALIAGFGRMPLRVMTADALYDSLRLAYGDPKLDLRSVDPKDGNTQGESAAVADPDLEFRRQFCTNEDDASDFTHGIPQMLTLLNHPRLRAGSKALEEYLKTPPAQTPVEIVAWLYRATLSRQPTPNETADALDYLRRGGDSAGLLWTLVNRSEYLFVP